MDLQTLDKLDAAHSKKGKLLAELREAITYETCDVSIEQVGGSRDFYVVYNKQGHALPIEGTLTWCKRKCDLRKLRYMVRDQK
jgi:hypothetical protein